MIVRLSVLSGGAGSTSAGPLRATSRHFNCPCAGWTWCSATRAYLGAVHLWNAASKISSDSGMLRHPVVARRNLTRRAAGERAWRQEKLRWAVSNPRRSETTAMRPALT